MSEIEPINGIVRRGLEPLQPVDWRSVKQQMYERYAHEVRIHYGAVMTERAHEGLQRIRTRVGDNPDQLDMLLVHAYVFGAAELIHDYMRGR